MIILTDSRSNISSLLSAGSRDEVEERITRNLTTLAGNGVRMEIRWIRAYRGTEGNEIADSLAKMGRWHIGGGKPGSYIAINLAKSRLIETIKLTQKSRIDNRIHDRIE